MRSQPFILFVISENGNSHFSTPTPPIKKIEIKLSPPSTSIKQQLLIMNHLIMANILNNGVNFDEFNARLKAHKVHNKHETGFLKNKTNKFVAKSSKMSKTYNNKPTKKLHDRKLRW